MNRPWGGSPSSATALTSPSSRDPANIELARVQTRSWLADRAGRGEALEQFVQTQRRRLGGQAELPTLKGDTVLVTGGTGCIGTELLRIVAECQPRRVVSLARGKTPQRFLSLGVDYRCADISDVGVVRQQFHEVKPDVVIHLAAVRDPGLAERRVVETIRTNIGGTQAVITEAMNAGVRRIVVASTGKASRLYSESVYAATKAVVEYVTATLTHRDQVDRRAVRFTHIVDNSILFRRLQYWTRTGYPVYLHGMDVQFYIQSAREAAELILEQCGDEGSGTQTVAQRDLGWPIDLLQLSLDVIEANRSGSPVVCIGHERGYEDGVFSGTYDYSTAGQCSPLLNGVEAERIRVDASVPYDAFDPPTTISEALDAKVGQLMRLVVDHHRASSLRSALRQCEVELLRWRLEGASVPLLQRAVRASQGNSRYSRSDEIVAGELRRELGRRDLP